jgi:hypothetical protein
MDYPFYKGDIELAGQAIREIKEKGTQEVLDKTLQDAVAAGYENIVDYLLDKGANPNYVNKFGETSLALAKKHGNDDIIKLLTERSVAQTVGTTSNSSSNSSSSGGRRRKLKKAKKSRKAKKSKKSRKSKKGKKYTRRSA